MEEPIGIHRKRAHDIPIYTLRRILPFAKQNQIRSSAVIKIDSLVVKRMTLVCIAYTNSVYRNLASQLSQHQSLICSVQQFANVEQNAAGGCQS